MTGWYSSSWWARSLESTNEGSGSGPSLLLYDKILQRRLFAPPAGHPCPASSDKTARPFYDRTARPRHFASEKEFLKWKALSDEDYHASEKEAHVYANHTLALDELSEEAASIPAVDVCMEQAHDRAEAIHRSVRKVTQIRKHLTDTQFRRVWMYFVDGMTVDEIGAAEGVSHQNISKSIGAAMKKMKKLFPDC